MDEAIILEWEAEARKLAAAVGAILDKDAPTDFDLLPEIEKGSANGSNSADEAFLALLDRGEHLNSEFLAHAYDPMTERR